MRASQAISEPAWFPSKLPKRSMALRSVACKTRVRLDVGGAFGG
jgi:hypothetical protein